MEDTLSEFLLDLFQVFTHRAKPGSPSRVRDGGEGEFKNKIKITKSSRAELRAQQR